jgi:hypothetical protein
MSPWLTIRGGPSEAVVPTKLVREILSFGGLLPADRSPSIGENPQVSAAFVGRDLLRKPATVSNVGLGTLKPPSP